MKKIRRDPKFGNLFEKFTLVVFNPKDPKKLKGRITPDIGTHVTTLQGWREPDSLYGVFGEYLSNLPKPSVKKTTTVDSAA